MRRLLTMPTASAIALPGAFNGPERALVLDAGAAEEAAAAPAAWVVREHLRWMREQGSGNRGNQDALQALPRGSRWAAAGRWLGGCCCAEESQGEPAAAKISSRRTPSTTSPSTHSGRRCNVTAQRQRARVISRELLLLGLREPRTREGRVISHGGPHRHTPS